MQLPILFEDKNLVVVNKPPNLVVNRSETTKDSITLQDLVEEQISPFIELKEELKRNPDFIEGLDEIPNKKYAEMTDEQKADLAYKDFIRRTGIVHRLDKDTSGAIIIAKNYDTFLILQKQFADRKVKKMYFAIVYESIRGAKKGDLIRVNAPIDRNPNNREKFAVVEGGRNAETEFEIVDIINNPELGTFSVVNCFPKTGRTHQIRVHLSALNTPVAGDMLYGGRTRSKKYKNIFARQMLHAYRIEFFHPKTGKQIEIKAPLPKDIKDVLKLLYNSNFVK